MRVLISSGFPYWNAEAAYAAILTRLLREAGHGALIAAPPGTRNAEELARRGLEPITTLPRADGAPWHWPGLLRGLANLQARESIDIVDVFRSAEYPFHLMASRGPARGAATRPRLVRTRGGARPERGSWLNRRMYGPWCDSVIASADIVRQRLIDRLDTPPGRITTIYFPVELPPIPPPRERRKIRGQFLQSLGLESERLVVGVVGRIAPEKGHDVLLEAVARLVPDHPELAVVIGNKAYPSEAPHRARLEKRIGEMGLGGRVFWLGYREDMDQVMAAIDIGVIPSVASEMNCRVAVEFLAAATPVVALPTGALPEVVSHGVSGRIAASHDPGDLAQELALLAKDRALRETLGAQGRQEAERRFSTEQFLESTLEVYQRALDGA